ncbi:MULTISPECIES: hypothetical protein [Agrobacterium]|uniref:hypothetical protein n=1 Tax=Agrobacterium TaxID=357 RepID=UPI0009BC520F|nr:MULTISPECIES: hypothetical protein [Agrobacterium]WCK03748.1 hypothetical protein G6L31_013975 [Agrobacterium tumefaciens]CUX64489.1 conserved hypothetical protein [Agrobacterium sp. NCPPB 925]
MPFKPSYEDLALRDGIASLPEMENIKLELPLPRQVDAENRIGAVLEPDPSNSGTGSLTGPFDRHRRQ